MKYREKDIVEQLVDGKITPRFEFGSEDNWNALTLIYSDGTNSVKVSGVSVDNISLKFDGDAWYAASNATADVSIVLVESEILAPVFAQFTTVDVAEGDSIINITIGSVFSSFHLLLIFFTRSQ